jgi:hypothetical protein
LKKFEHWIRDFDTVIKYFDQRTCARNRKILINVCREDVDGGGNLINRAG